MFRVCTRSGTFLRCLFSAHDGMESISLSRAETGREKYQAGNSFETKFSFDSTTRKHTKCSETLLFTYIESSRQEYQ